MKTLGQKIRELREKKDLSLRELAREIQVSAAFLSDIELGRRYPSDNILLSLSEKLEISVNELQTYDTRPPIDDIKRLASSNPKYALAFRKVIDKKISAEELLKFAEKSKKEKS